MATKARDFQFKGWDLTEAIDALHSYDEGARDSGISDSDLRAAVVSYLKELDDDLLRKVLAEYARRFLSDDAILAGYGLGDVHRFIIWLSDLDIYVE